MNIENLHEKNYNREWPKSIEGLHEKKLFSQKLPFRLIINHDVDFNYPPHWHNAFELVYVLENPFTVYVNYTHYLLRERDILFIPAGSIHEFRNETKTGTRIFVNAELSGLSLYGDVDPVRSQLRSVHLIRPEDGAVYTQITSQIQKMSEWDESARFPNTLYYTARVLDLLVLLCELNPPQIHRESAEDGNKKLIGLDKIDNCFEYIEKNYKKDLRLKDVAQAVGFSEYYFSRLFKEITEKSFRQYLGEYRLEKAATMLIDANCSVSEAAYAAGFRSMATFDRLFQQIKGCSPQEFRKLKR